MRKKSIYIIILALFFVIGTGIGIAGLVGNHNNTQNNTSLNQTNSTNITTTNYTEEKIENKPKSKLLKNNNSSTDHKKDDNGCKDGVCPINGHK